MANVYLHYVFDLWVKRWRKHEAHGDVIVVRFADDFIVGFQSRTDAERFWEDLKQRLQRFGLELHPDKTHLLEFGRFAAANRRQRGLGKPNTFDFLGFTHISGQTRKGKFIVYRKTISKRLRERLKAIRAELRRKMHWSVPEVGKWLGAVLRGYYGYHAVPLNFAAIRCVYRQVIRSWYRTLRRRSHRTRVTWPRVERLAQRYLPRPSILHPWPWERLRVTT